MIVLWSLPLIANFNGFTTAVGLAIGDVEFPATFSHWIYAVPGSDAGLFSGFSHSLPCISVACSLIMRCCSRAGLDWTCTLSIVFLMLASDKLFLA